MLSAGMSSTDSINSASQRSWPLRTGANATPQLPSTTEVTPCQHDEVASGIPRDLRVEVRVHVDEARRDERAVGVDLARPPSATSPTAVMRSPSIATSAACGRCAGAVDDDATCESRDHACRRG